MTDYTHGEALEWRDKKIADLKALCGELERSATLANQRTLNLEAEVERLRAEFRWFVTEQGGAPAPSISRDFAAEDRIAKLMADIGLDEFGRKPKETK